MQPLQGQTEKSPSRIRAMFSAIAPTYDFLNHLLSLSVDRSWRATAVRVALESIDGRNRSPWGPALRILDVATGTGDLALAFADRAGPAARILGIDFAPPMLRIAREKTQRRGFHHCVHFAEADAQKIPFPDSSFDLASIAFGLRNTEQPDQALRELARVVRPGGCVVVLEFAQPANPVFRRLFHFYFHRILPRIGGLVSRSSAYRYLPDSVQSFWDAAEFRRRFQETGLTLIGTWWLSGGIAGLHVGRREMSSTGDKNQ